jgi:ActR/RegA family two-component response regulator
MPFHALIASGDDCLVQRFLTAMADVGIRLEAIPDASRVAPELASRHYEAVLLDFDLEGGVKLLEEIRHEPSTRNALVIAFVSGIEAAKTATRMGANFILSKPINWEVAKRTLRAAHTLIIRERRGSIREKVRVPAKVMFRDQIIEVTIFDLSDGGLAVRTPVTLPRAMNVGVHLMLPGATEIIECKGVVAWASEGLAGIEFSQVATRSAKVIVSWLDHHSPRRAQAKASR